MYEDFIADELTIERCINEGFFKSCQVKWPELSIKDIEKIVPKFKFGQPPEDKDVEQKRDLEFSLMIRNYAMSAQMFGGNKFWKGDEKVVKSISKKVTGLVEGEKDKKLPEKKDKK